MMATFPCTSAPYPSHIDATVAKKKLLREYNLAVTVIHCEGCDAYHLPLNIKRLHVPKKALEVAQHYAMGYTLQEIADIMKIKKRTLQWYVEALKHSLSASTIPHMVCILISLGVINPRDFVPQLKEHPHG